MELRDRDVMTPLELKKQVTAEIISQLPIPKEQHKEAEDWNFVKHKVSDSLMETLVGRPRPVGRLRVTPVRDAFLLTRKWTPPTYPKKCKTDEQKQNYLKERLFTNDIDIKAYEELCSVLNVKRSKKKIMF